MVGTVLPGHRSKKVCSDFLKESMDHNRVIIIVPCYLAPPNTVKECPNILKYVFLWMIMKQLYQLLPDTCKAVHNRGVLNILTQL